MYLLRNLIMEFVLKILTCTALKRILQALELICVYHHVDTNQVSQLNTLNCNMIYSCHVISCYVMMYQYILQWVKSLEVINTAIQIFIIQKYLKMCLAALWTVTFKEPPSYIYSRELTELSSSNCKAFVGRKTEITSVVTLL